MRKNILKVLLIFILSMSMVTYNGCMPPQKTEGDESADTAFSDTVLEEFSSVTEAQSLAESESVQPQIDIPVIADTDIMIDVPYISQEGILPNGCEAVSAVMVLQYYGFDIGALDFVHEYLDMGYFTRDDEERLFGPDPEYWYAGDPESEDGGFGCYVPALVSALERYLPEDYSALDLSGSDLEILANNFLVNDIPIILWLTTDMRVPERMVNWYDLEDYGEEEPRLIEYPANLHVLVLCGYDGENFIFADPYESRGVVKYSVEDTVRVYESMGNRAIAVVKSA